MKFDFFYHIYLNYLDWTPAHLKKPLHICKPTLLNSKFAKMSYITNKINQVLGANTTPVRPNTNTNLVKPTAFKLTEFNVGVDVTVNIDLIKKFISHCDKQCKIISIIGTSRNGKSSFLNCVMQHIAKLNMRHLNLLVLKLQKVRMLLLGLMPFT